MKMPKDLDCIGLSEKDVKILTNIIKEIEQDGYFMITGVKEFTNSSVVLANIRGKDPMLSSMKKCVIDTKMLKALEQVIKGNVSYNFKIDNSELYLPRSVPKEKFSVSVPNGMTGVSSFIELVAKTPLEILWRLIYLNYGFVIDGYQVVPCHQIYFGHDNFSVKVDYEDRDGQKKTFNIMSMEDGRYLYNKITVTPLNPELSVVDDVISCGEDLTLRDRMGIIRNCKVIDLSRYEKNMFNQARYEKMYDKDFTLTVLGRMYSMASYLNGLNMILSDIGVAANRFAIPYRNANSFFISSGKQHNTFSIQEAWYKIEIFDEIKRIYFEHKNEFVQYLKTKDESLREQLYEIVEEQCIENYGPLLHYFVNGVLDALCIQKGDKVVRQEILSKYSETVHKEFVMYGCYYYDLRTLFLRNNHRIVQEFSSTLVVNEYNGYYFRVG